MCDRNGTSQLGMNHSSGMVRRTFVAKAAGLAAGIGLAPGFATPVANAQSSSPSRRGGIKIAVMGDMTGSTSDWAGQGAIESARLAIEDFGSTVLGEPIELISIDHQNKADIASAQARELFDVRNVDMILNLSNSSVSLAVMEVGRQKKRITIITAAGADQITNANCSPYAIHYVFNANALANAVTAPLVRAGQKDWFLLVADFAYGASLAKKVNDIVSAEGGRVIGAVKHPAYTITDFSSFVLQAQSSGAQVIGLANSSADTVNSVKSLSEFGIMGSQQKVVAYTMITSDIYSIGLETSRGLQFASAFYWDRNDATRAWSKRFYERRRRMPNMINAGDYSAALHYLKAVSAAATNDADAVMAKMRELPVDDIFANGGRIRVDGLHVHDFYLMEVKKPSESKYPWDDFYLRQTIPGDVAYPPLSASTCPLTKQ